MEHTTLTFNLLNFALLILPLIHALSNFEAIIQTSDIQHEENANILCKPPDGSTTQETLHLQCQFNLDGKPVTVNLRRINPHRYDIPVYLWDVKGMKKYTTDEKIENYYQNDDNTMTVTVKQQHGNVLLTGTFIQGKTTYIVHPNYIHSNHRFIIITSSSPLKKLGIAIPNRNNEDLSRRSSATSSDISSDMHTVEVLVWIDYRMYSYIHDNVTSITHSSTVNFLSEYIGVLFDSVNIPYRKLAGHGIHINIKPVALHISTVASASPWTEHNVIPSKTKDEAINITKALHSFEKYVDSHTHLPAHDHAMLITYYEVEDNDELSENDTEVKGIATLSAMCQRNSASVISDRLDFETAFTVAHEIGHGLGCKHDEEDNTCKEDDGYVMTPVIKRNTTHEWRFSSCSISYIKTLISNLNHRHKNCLLRLDNQAVEVTVTAHNNDWYGQVYTPDQQCQLQYGPKSFFDRSDFNHTGSYQSRFCLRMDCYDPSIDKYYESVPGDGTACGKNKWCQAGLCVTAPSSMILLGQILDSCPHGDGPDQLVADIWEEDQDVAVRYWTKTCKDYIRVRPEHCYDQYVRAICCEECSNVTSSYPNGLPSSVYNNVPNVNTQCASLFGANVTFCKTSSTYNESFEPVCDELRCQFADNFCHETYASDGTPCGKKKWCILGKCTADTNAPDLPSDCLFGDDPTYVRYNMHCDQLIKTRPQDCYNTNVKEKCCESCRNAASTPIDFTKIPSPDDQCKSIFGQQSYFCQNVDSYSTNFHSMCGEMYCQKPGTKLCYSTQAADGTACGHKRICRHGNCTYDVNGPNYRDDCIFPNENSWCDQNIFDKDTAYRCTFGHNVDVCCFNCQKYRNTSMPANCQYGDMGNYESHDLRCKDLIARAPQECYHAKTKQQCCDSCYKIPKFNTASPGIIPSKDHQCQELYGPSSTFCDGVSTYKTNPGAVCQTLYCSKPHDNLCHGITAADGTSCGNGKWCVEGQCVTRQSGR